MLVDDVKKEIHRIVDGMFEHLDVRVCVTQAREVMRDHGLAKVKIGQGRAMSIHIEVPRAKRESFDDEVTVERLERNEWRACAWPEMLPGDVVRFRNPDGMLQRDFGYRDPDSGKLYSEVRDWVVVEIPRIGDRITITSSVRVEPHDGDIAKEGV